MRIALLIAGYLRGLKENVDSIKNNIIQSHNCDIYIYVTDDADDKYLNEQLSISYIKTELNPVMLVFSKNLHFSDNQKINNILNQNYKYYHLNENRIKKCNEEVIVYDVVIKLRPDACIKTTINYENVDSLYIPIDSKIDISKLQTPDDKYICDIFAYGTPDKMNYYFNYYLHLIELFKKYNTRVNETLLFHYLQSIQLKYELIDLQYVIILSLCNVIAITGDSGSGKTSISNVIKSMFKNSFLLECDRYHKWERGDKNWNLVSHLNPESNYITKMCNDVFDLKVGNSIYQVDYNHDTGRFTDNISVCPTDNIIVCGLHSLYVSDSIVNLKIYMDTDDNLRIPWKIKRDVAKRGYSIDKVYLQIKERQSDYLTHIYPQKNMADVIICYYTDSVFDICTFDINMEYSIYLKIHIKKNFNFDLTITEMQKLDCCNEYFTLYFNKIDNYNEIIRRILISLKCL